MDINWDSPEAKEALQKAVTEQTAGLAAKNKELLAEVKEARKSRTIDPKEIEDRDAEIETLKAKVSEVEKTAKTATTEAEKSRKLLESAEGFTHRLLVDNGLNDALATAGVTNPVLLKAAKSVLGSQVQIVADGENRVAKVGDKAISDFVKEWAVGDEGKHFVAAPQNSGGGSTGGGDGGAAKGNLGGTKAERLAAITANLS